MKRKIFAATFILCLLTAVANCGGSKYSDVIEVNDEFVGITGDYLSSLDKADSAKEVASAMDRFSDGLDEILPKMKKMKDKYPELKDPENIPEELKSSQKKAEEMSTQFATSFGKLFQYMRDPEVREAQKRLSEAWQKNM